MIVDPFYCCTRYDTQEKVLVKDLPSKSRDLMRRYYLVERAKEASIVGIVVGTLGVAGYNEAIQRVRDIVASAGQMFFLCLSHSLGRIKVEVVDTLSIFMSYSN
jgi:diphthamide biosynthesis enzyme Dph1/Dph2-like protein